jgi:hypothetical protein
MKESGGADGGSEALASRDDAHGNCVGGLDPPGGEAVCPRLKAWVRPDAPDGVEEGAALGSTLQRRLCGAT